MDDAGVSQIDVFVNSHYHDDHFGGIDELVEAGIPVFESFDRGEKAKKCFSAETMTKGRFGDYMRTVGEDAKVLRPGDTIPIDSLVTITATGSSGRVIGDTAPVNHCHENDLSVSLLLSFAGFTAFFGGDTEEPTEAKIASRDLVMNVDLYKASHHGSDTSSSSALMNDLQPSVVVISNGGHKGFQHPRQVTLDTYHALKPTPPVVYQTNKCLHPSPCCNEPNSLIADLESSDEDGTIAVTVDGATNSNTVAFGSITRSFPIKNPAAPVVPASAGVVITSFAAESRRQRRSTRGSHDREQRYGGSILYRLDAAGSKRSNMESVRFDSAEHIANGSPQRPSDESEQRGKRNRARR